MQRVNAKYERIWYEREGWVEEGSEAIHDPPSQTFIQGGGKGGNGPDRPTSNRTIFSETTVSHDPQFQLADLARSPGA